MAAPATDALRPDALDLVAELLRYPRPGYETAILACRDALAASHPRSAEGIARFARAAEGLRLEELQELYTRSFDLDPVAALEVGWHLYGESYDRGRFLVRMRQLLEEVGVEETTELPDHLISVLPVLARLEPESAAELARSSVLPALERMLGGLAGNKNPYENVLRALAEVLSDRFPQPHAKRPSSAPAQSRAEGSAGEGGREPSSALRPERPEGAEGSAEPDPTDLIPHHRRRTR